MSIRDAANNGLTYWPISGVEEGEDSAHLVFYVDTPQEGVLRATSSSNHAQIWARAGGAGPFTDITNGEIDLSGLPWPQTEFEMYVKAVGPIDGFERVSLTVNPSAGSAAAWLV